MERITSILLLLSLTWSLNFANLISSPLEGILNLTKEKVNFNQSEHFCERDLVKMKQSIKDRQLWALKMLDASGSPGSGFLFGNNFWLGSQLQCLDINLPLRGEILKKTSQNMSEFLNAVSPIETHFLVATFTHNATLQEHTGLPNEDLVTLGLCLPRSCKPTHINEFLGRLFNNQARPLSMQRLMNVDLNLLNVRSVEDDSSWLSEPKFIIVMSLLGLAALLTFFGSMYDVYIWRRHVTAKNKIAAIEDSNGNNNNADNNNAEKRRVSEQFQLLVHEQNSLTEKRNKLVLSADDEKWLSYKQGTFGKFLLCFSVPNNTKALMDPSLGQDSVPCLHGLRFMGMGWIIMVHTIFYQADYCDNRVQAFRMAEGFAVQVVANSTLAVDTFFFLSGFLIAYLFYKGDKPIPNQTVDKTPVTAATLSDFLKATQRFFLLIARRFLRLTPVYMMMVGIFDINQSKYNRTSLFTTTERADVTCGKYWWRNLLYINNVYSREEMCMSWSWYLSNDMQFFIIGTFLLLLSTSYRAISASILSALLAASCAITAYISYSVNYVPTLSQQFNMLNVLYDPPWTRIGPYLVGMVTGWIVVQLNGNLPLKRWQVWTCWLLGSACNVSVLFGLTEREISPSVAAAYVGLSRSVWGVGLAWIVIACSTKHAGIVSTILEFPGWVPLSRLTYCAYLLNPMLMQSVYLGSESAMHVDFLPLATYFFGHLGMCYFCSYVLSLLFESPNILVMRWLISERGNKKN